MSSIYQMLPGNVAPTVTRDMILERNRAFLEAHASITPTQLYGHRIATIVDTLQSLFLRESTPQQSRYHAIRVGHYLDLLMHEMVRRIGLPKRYLID